MEHLEGLRLENNRLHGYIPTKLARLPRLADLRLGGNALLGCLSLTWPVAQARYDNVEPDLLCHPPPWRKPGLFEDAARLMLRARRPGGGGSAELELRHTLSSPGRVCCSIGRDIFSGWTCGI